MSQLQCTLVSIHQLTNLSGVGGTHLKRSRGERRKKNTQTTVCYLPGTQREKIGNNVQSGICARVRACVRAGVLRALHRGALQKFDLSRRRQREMI